MSKVLNFVAWFTGVVVSLAVGMGLIDTVLKLPNWLGGDTMVGLAVTQAAGWIVVVTTLIGAVMALIRE
jgi:hypothetical protein